MKISKVDHTKSAVSRKRGGTIGILYKYPSNSPYDREKNIEWHFDNIVNKNAKRLYHILNPENKDQEYGKVDKDLRDVIKKYIKKLVGYNDSCKGSPVDKQLKFIDGDLVEMAEYLFIYKEKEYVHQLVSAYLRKSLRKNVKKEGTECDNNEDNASDGKTVVKCSLPCVIEKILRALCIEESVQENERVGTYRQAIKEIDRDELRTFLKYLNLDYTRSKQKEGVIRSIQNQNVKATVIDRDKVCLLRPSYADHEKKSAIFRFMCKYADGNEEGRSRLLRSMRNLIVLYVCGEKVYNEFLDDGAKTNDFTAFSIEDELVFCPAAEAIFCEQGPKAFKKRLREAYEYELVKHYKESLAVCSKEVDEDIPFDISDYERKRRLEEGIREKAFWLDFIEQEVKGAINLSKPEKDYKNKAVFLCRKVWQRWTAFMAEKYIDLGKAVYHFAMPVMPSDKNAPINVGIVRRKYKRGLTSFDYERIKAVENMERSVSVAVTFAVNNLSRSALKPSADVGSTDVLFLKQDELDKRLFKNTGHQVLRYFGGASLWTRNDVVQDALKDKGTKLFWEIKTQLEDLRNGSYHYTQQFSGTEAIVLLAMLEDEKRLLGPIIRKKYYSNNTHWFYPEEKLNALMDDLYQAPAVRGDQIPAFKRLYNRQSLYDEKEIFTADERKKIDDLGTEKVDKFQGAAFFVYKEIYYYDFLRDRGIAEVFRTLVDSNKVPCDNTKARDSFRKRIKDIPEDASMGEIAQIIMTDYNLQNQQKETAQLAAEEDKMRDKEKYKSFPMILYRYMRLTFIKFLRKNNEKYSFLSKELQEQPDQQKISEKDFLDKKTDFANMMFQDLSLDKKGEKSIAPWYVLGHMIPPTHLNHLSGAIRSYIRYIKDIEKRADHTRNKNDEVCKANVREAVYFGRVLDVLEFCRFFCGRTSNDVLDYYDIEDGDTVDNNTSEEKKKKRIEASKKQYTDEILKYIDIGLNAEDSEKRMDALRSFCGEETGYKKPDGSPQKIELYYADVNVKLNRNIVIASLYGTDKVIQNAANKVTKDDILEYYQWQDALSTNNSTQQPGADAQMFKSRKAQENRKNRVELVNVKIYSDILNDLVTQLVSWCYFRERDRMYFELGMQYVKIFYGEHTEESSLLRRLIWPDVVNIKEGAVLYQIVAKYTYHLPLYQVVYNDDRSVITEIKERVGKYSYKEEYYEKYCKAQRTGQNDMYFFEVEKDRKTITDLRNYIDHFAYFVKADRSILDLYSDFYNMAFSYSENFRKSVTFILPNILSRYFVMTGVHFESDKRDVVNSNGVSVGRNCARIEVDKELKPFQFTHKIKADPVDDAVENTGNKNAENKKGKKEQPEPITADSRDQRFLEDISKILHYPSKLSRSSEK